MNKTDYLNDAFGGFNPLKDQDAALKFCLNALLMENRIEDINFLLPDFSEVGGFEGEPGWIVERRNTCEIYGYENWPTFARFRAFVDPNSFELTYPEFYCDRPTFISFVRKAIRAYSWRNPVCTIEVTEILKTLSATIRPYQ
jgi:hypothetical protein